MDYFVHELEWIVFENKTRSVATIADCISKAFKQCFQVGAIFSRTLRVIPDNWFSSPIPHPHNSFSDWIIPHDTDIL